MFKPNKGAGSDAGDDFAAGDDQKETSQGDGRHHHEIHEDEGGGYHSKHTHPDGQVEHEDHATYQDAADDMNGKFGHGEGDGDEDSEGEEMSPDDIAGSYGRAACED
jgi:hypothetical protein